MPTHFIETVSVNANTSICRFAVLGWWTDWLTHWQNGINFGKPILVTVSSIIGWLKLALMSLYVDG